MKIAFFEMEKWEEDFFSEKLNGHELYFDTNPISLETLARIKDYEIVSGMIYSEFQEEIIEKLSNLQMISTRSTGFDHIDLKACKEKNILVCNVPEYGSVTVAEHTFALILALSRKIVPSAERTRRGDFDLEGLRGFDLKGKTLGVVGLGSIGKSVVRIAQGFGLRVLVYTRSPDPSLVGGGLEVEFVDLDELLSRSDIVSLHVPYSQSTHHLINKENIQNFKKGSLLINTARGGIVETEAILVGLESGILGGAGLDVLEEECMVKEENQLLTKKFLEECDIKTQLLNHVLLTKENVVITPHNAFNSVEALQRIVDVTAENIRGFIDKSPKNVVG